jgi:hypothetical protein
VSDIDARLATATNTVLSEISRTDGKSAVLLTSFSLPLAVLVGAIPGRTLPGTVAMLVGLGTVGLVAAMLVVLVVVRPRLRGAAKGSYLYWSECTPEEVVEDLLEPGNQAAHVVHLSRIARRKFRGLQVAIDLTAIALITLAGAMLTALV